MIEAYFPTLPGLPGASRQNDTAVDIYAFGICTLEVNKQLGFKNSID